MRLRIKTLEMVERQKKAAESFEKTQDYISCIYVALTVVNNDMDALFFKQTLNF